MAAPPRERLHPASGKQSSRCGGGNWFHQQAAASARLRSHSFGPDRGNAPPAPRTSTGPGSGRTTAVCGLDLRRSYLRLPPPLCRRSAACLRELRRVVKPGGTLGMVEFAVPRGVWKPWWRLYSGVLLPFVGRLVGQGWHEVGGFLRTSIEDFHRAHPDQAALWRGEGLTEVKATRLSLGGGVVVWAQRP